MLGACASLKTVKQVSNDLGVFVGDHYILEGGGVFCEPPVLQALVSREPGLGVFVHNLEEEVFEVGTDILYFDLYLRDGVCILVGVEYCVVTFACK